MTNTDIDGLVFGEMFFGEESDKDKGVDIDEVEIPAPKAVRIPRAYRSRALFGHGYERETLAEDSIFSRPQEDLTLRDVINL